MHIEMLNICARFQRARVSVRTQKCKRLIHDEQEKKRVAAASW